MRSIWCLSAAALLSVSAQAATVIQVPRYPGAQYTFVYDINDNNQIAGGYYDSGGGAGAYFGKLSGGYNTFTYGSFGVQARSIDNDGNVTGISNFLDGHKVCLYVPFERSADRTITAIHRGKTPLHGFLSGIGANSRFAGDYCNAAGDSIGYVGRSGHWREDVVISEETTSTQPRDVNRYGVVVGAFADGKYLSGFVLKDGATTVIKYPGAKNTIIAGVNNSGVAVGFWDKGNYKWRSFMLDTATNIFTEIKVPQASYVQVSGINNAGLITLNASSGPYIYCPDGVACPAAGAKVDAPRFPMGGLPTSAPDKTPPARDAPRGPDANGLPR